MTTLPQVQWLGYEAPRNKEELARALELLFGFKFPRRAVCPGHSAPLDVLAEAYFAEHQVVLWWASRGFGGKTTMLAALSLLELVTKYDVVLLGGSGEQSQRAHRVTTAAWDHKTKAFICVCGHVNLPKDPKYRLCEGCRLPWVDGDPVELVPPQEILDGDPIASRTRTKWGNEMIALTASTKSARGPHPQRLRMDEADEMDLVIVDAAMGQTMETDPDRPAQTVLASTYHRTTGTMRVLLQRAREFNWPVRKWCYRETVRQEEDSGSWLLERNIEAARMRVSSTMWRVEYDLETPEEGGLLLKKEALDRLFEAGTVTVEDPLGDELTLEEPELAADYVTGADWGKENDLTIIATLRYDCEPARLVAWGRFLGLNWLAAVGLFNERVERYSGEAIHDATGLGDVIHDMLTVEAEEFKMVGELRRRMFAEYEVAVEHGDLRYPRLRSLIETHETLNRADLQGKGHPPDEIVALALANLKAKGRSGTQLAERVTGTVGRPRRI